jgi:diguanylate cyclase (GGDEF)-like protein
MDVPIGPCIATIVQKAPGALQIGARPTEDFSETTRARKPSTGEVDPVQPAVQETRIRSLAEMARALGRSASLFRLLEIAAEEAVRALDAASVSVSRLEPGTSTVRTLVNVGQLGPTEERWPANETYDMVEFSNLALLTEERRPWRASIDDPAADAMERQLLADLGKDCAIGSPIVVDGQLWGEFYATRVAGRPSFENLDVSYMEALMAILGGAISRSLREESLEQLAYRDPLTGLLNRRALDEQAVEAFTVKPGARRQVTVVAVDINRLKHVNDTLGHLAGDQLIQSVARDLLTEFSRLPGTLVARIGGDEFTVLASAHHPDAVVAAADRLCGRTWRFGPGVGVSTGAATATILHGTDLTPARLFVAADRAQYVAKHGRLSTTVMADSLETDGSWAVPELR